MINVFEVTAVFRITTLLELSRLLARVTLKSAGNWVKTVLNIHNNVDSNILKDYSTS